MAEKYKHHFPDPSEAPAIDVLPASNGEFVPEDPSPAQLKIMALQNEKIEETRRKFGISRRQFVRTRTLAFPHGHPQERTIGFVSFLNQYGPALVERGLMEPPRPGEPGQFFLSEPGQIEELVRGAGFDDVSVSEVPVAFRAESWEEYRRIVSSLAATTC